MVAGDVFAEQGIQVAVELNSLEERVSKSFFVWKGIQNVNDCHGCNTDRVSGSFGYLLPDITHKCGTELTFGTGNTIFLRTFHPLDKTQQANFMNPTLNGLHELSLRSLTKHQEVSSGHLMESDDGFTRTGTAGACGAHGGWCLVRRHGL